MRSALQELDRNPTHSVSLTPTQSITLIFSWCSYYSSPKPFCFLHNYTAWETLMWNIDVTLNSIAFASHTYLLSCRIWVFKEKNLWRKIPWCGIRICGVVVFEVNTSSSQIRGSDWRHYTVLAAPANNNNILNWAWYNY